MWMADLIGGVVVLLFGLSIVFSRHPGSYSSEFGPGPGFLPFWLGIGISGCAVLVLAKILKQRNNRGLLQAADQIGRQMLVMIVIAFLLLPLLGFSVGLALFTATAMSHQEAQCSCAVSPPSEQQSVFISSSASG
jgi:hypothetical protein